MSAMVKGLESASADSFFQSLNESPMKIEEDSKNQVATIPIRLDLRQTASDSKLTFSKSSSSSSDTSETSSPGKTNAALMSGRTGRQRSNSKSSRQGKSIAPTPIISSSSASNNNTSNSSSTSVNNSNSNQNKSVRPHFQFNLILVSLNGTFEKKSLIIPFHPEVLKLGRPAGTKIQPTPTNGYFDSRVLSRQHAQLFADADSGKVYLKDLGSSNGTFVNEERISSDKDSAPTEIKKGDVIDLGFDIESHQNHRKISARVENIFVRPISGSNIGTHIGLPQDARNLANSFVEVEDELKNSILSNSFDSALFGDILTNFEDNVLNIKNDSMTGLSINSNLTTSSNLDFQIKTLINEIYLTKSSILKAKSIDVFLKKYIKNLKKIEIEKNEINKNKVKEYEHQLTMKYERDYKERYSEFESKIKKLNESMTVIKAENGTLNKKLQSVNDELKLVKEEKTDISNENNKLKNELESQKNELNDWKIKYITLEGQNRLIDKNVETTKKLKKVLKREILLMDNDSDSSTLNDDENREISTKRNENENDNEHEIESDDNAKQHLPSINSDEDFKIPAKNNVITDEKALKSSDNGYEDLLQQFEALKAENAGFKSKLAAKEDKINTLEDQLYNYSSDHQHWVENDALGLKKNGFNTPLTRTSSNVSMSSSVSSRNLATQSPLLGLFNPGLGKLRARNRSLSTTNDFEENEITGIDEDDSQLSPVISSRMFIKPENTRTSLVTAVGMVLVGIMVSKFSGSSLN